MHEGRVRCVYERRRLVTKPLLSPPWMWELKRNFPHKAGQFMLGPSFSFSSLFFPPFSSSAPSTSPPSLQSGVCLMKLSREREPSFFLLGRNALHAACKQRVVPSRALRCSPFRFCFYLLALSFSRQPWPTFPTLFVGEPTLLVALLFPRSFTWKLLGTTLSG